MFFDYKPKRVVRPPTAYATAGLAVINSDKSDAGTPKGRCCCAEWAVLQSETARFVVQDSPFQTAIRPALQPSVSQAVEENHRDGGMFYNKLIPDKPATPAGDEDLMRRPRHNASTAQRRALHMPSRMTCHSGVTARRRTQLSISAIMSSGESERLCAISPRLRRWAPNKP